VLHSCDDTVAAERDGIVILQWRRIPDPGQRLSLLTSRGFERHREAPYRRLLPSLLVVVASEI
jgi:hypothetical protein